MIKLVLIYKRELTVSDCRRDNMMSRLVVASNLFFFIKVKDFLMISDYA